MSSIQQQLQEQLAKGLHELFSIEVTEIVLQETKKEFEGAYTLVVFPYTKQAGKAPAAIATDFIMFEPDNGKQISENKKTEVKVLYDNDGVYIGVRLYDDEPSKILKEITERDDFGTTDAFGVFINGFNDGQQDFRFFVTAAGGQLDCIATEQTGEDFSWNAIWSSKAKITDFIANLNSTR